MTAMEELIAMRDIMLDRSKRLDGFTDKQYHAYADGVMDMYNALKAKIEGQCLTV